MTPDSAPAAATPTPRRASSLPFWTSAALLYPAWDLSAAVTFPLFAGETLTAESYVYGLFCVLLLAAAILAWVPRRVALVVAALVAAPALLLSRGLPLVSLLAALVMLLLRAVEARTRRGM